MSRRIRVSFTWDSSNSGAEFMAKAFFEALHEFRKHTDVLEFPGEIASLQILLINSIITVIIL